jgi:SAM-dependent methyltransferase
MGLRTGGDDAPAHGRSTDVDEQHTRWQQLTGGAGGEEYAARFAELAAKGADVHGEAAFVAGLLPGPGRILDGGCGTGRVAVRLAELGHDCTGVDADESMLAVARREAPALTWLAGDLADLPPGAVAGAPYDVVLLAGNVVPLLAPGTLTRTVKGLAAVLRHGGLLVAGFGLDRAHLPPGCPVTPLADYEQALADAGLEPVERFGTWDREPWAPATGYVVSVHRRAGGDAP